LRGSEGAAVLSELSCGGAEAAGGWSAESGFASWATATNAETRIKDRKIENVKWRFRNLTRDIDGALLTANNPWNVIL
jgi:hypothetical protein